MLFDEQTEIDNFLVDMKKNLSKIDFDSPNSNINNDVCNLTTIFKTVLNKHVPLRTMTRKEKRLSEKPLDNKRYSGFYQNKK